jgi:hypothetical protein
VRQVFPTVQHTVTLDAKPIDIQPPPLAYSFKGQASNGTELSDSQLEAMERGFEGVVACRSFGIGSGYLLSVLPNETDQPHDVPGIAWERMFVEAEK